ncbi:MAG: hypothetical protein JWM76_160 [Pseudonocardiales bacterium]|nr:hypothetical protein [Pseudonocardiales bacterium]
MGAQSAEWIAMARVVRRAGWGATGPEIDAAVLVGRAAYIDSLVAIPSTDRGAAATPSPSFDVIAPLAQGADVAAQQQRNQALGQQLLTLGDWWLRRMIGADQPFSEKLTFTWHNHFATSAEKVLSAPAMLAQNTTLRRLGRGDFRELAQAMLVDPAMLNWLDGQQNTVKGANENLAREFMELFALGHGVAYSESDVRDGARALTGWRIDPSGVAVLQPKLHDSTGKTVLGVTGDLDQAGFGDAVLAQPGSARHITSRMYRQFVSDRDPSPAVVNRMVAAYGHRRDLSSLIRTLFTDPSFDAGAGSYVIGPVEWLVGAVRALGLRPAPGAPARTLLAVLRSLGQVPFYPPNVSGWPSGQAWLSTSAADLRVRAATALVRGVDLSAIEATAPSDRIDAVGYRLGIGSWSARTVAALRPSLDRPPQLVAVALNSPEYLVH